MDLTITDECNFDRLISGEWCLLLCKFNFSSFNTMAEFIAMTDLITSVLLGEFALR